MNQRHPWLIIGVVLAIGVTLLTSATSIPAFASSTWTTEHEFQLIIPDGWNIQLNPAQKYNEPDLVAMAQTSDQRQEINVYRETLGTGERNALDYLRNSFASAAGHRAKFEVLETPDTWDVDYADTGAYGAYLYTDDSGVAQEVDRVVAVRGNTVYELNVLPTAAYASQNYNTVFGVLDSFQLLP
jgi:hypothetical protein